MPDNISNVDGLLFELFSEQDDALVDLLLDTLCLFSEVTEQPRQEFSISIQEDSFSSLSLVFVLFF